MDETRTELEEKYRQAIYVVIAKTGEIRFQIGENSAQTDALLTACNAERFAFITADNPRSQVLSAADNELRRHALINLLNAEKLYFLEGYGADKDEKWGREASVMILNIPEEKAREIARKFEQNAIVCGKKNEKIKLIWCSDK
jgi:hypothetical protein